MNGYTRHTWKSGDRVRTPAGKFYSNKSAEGKAAWVAYNAQEDERNNRPQIAAVAAYNAQEDDYSEDISRFCTWCYINYEDDEAFDEHLLTDGHKNCAPTDPSTGEPYRRYLEPKVYEKIKNEWNKSHHFGRFYCTECSYKSHSVALVRAHIKGKKHIAKAAAKDCPIYQLAENGATSNTIPSLTLATRAEFPFNLPNYFAEAPDTLAN